MVLMRFESLASRNGLIFGVILRQPTFPDDKNQALLEDPQSRKPKGRLYQFSFTAN